MSTTIASASLFFGVLHFQGTVTVASVLPIGKELSSESRNCVLPLEFSRCALVVYLELQPF